MVQYSLSVVVQMFHSVSVMKQENVFEGNH